MTEALDPEAAQAAIEYCYAQGWSDGLPVVPASQPLVDRFLATTDRSPDEVIGQLEQVGRDCMVYLGPRSTRPWPAACRSTSRWCWPRSTP